MSDNNLKVMLNGEEVKAGEDFVPVAVDSQGTLDVNFLHGTTSAPAFQFSNDGNTGFYHSGSGTIHFAVGGKRVISEQELKSAREHLEAMYISGKLTKEQVIEKLKEYYEDDGLTMAETVEEIELAKEAFFKKIKETL